MTIEEICEKYSIENYIINDDGSIDVNGSVDLSNEVITELPLKFGTVSGSFYCFENDLTTLKGSPKFVGRDFHCYENQLTSLEGSPEVVGDWFQCDSNKLTSLKGGPIKVGGSYVCVDNYIVDLDDITEEIGDRLICNNNPIASIDNQMSVDFLRAFKSFKVLKDGVINLKRLRYLMGMFDKPILIEEIENNYTIK